MVSRFIEETGQEEEYSDEVSGSSEGCYDYVYPDRYHCNDDAHPIDANGGFSVGPLCPEIFGAQAAAASRMKHAKLKELRSRNFSET